ncbi:cystatin domain-containing protein [Flammeovirga sp. SubArs3]|uniref:cystatin domain-containing protein n=1 Tax=Flammeovirga sp. SubArs3 TaxID=2995316 RepID=UPI00248C606A|nr:cystatin domain-containing protein [Flammeovirga sp. SubArs3]
MNSLKHILFLLVTVVFFSSCGGDNAKNDESHKQEQLVGGWSESEVTPEAEKALDYVLKQMNTSAKLDKITHLRTQIVSGRNYDIDFLMDNGKAWNVKVYQDLQGNYEITKTATRIN